MSEALEKSQHTVEDRHDQLSLPQHSAQANRFFRRDIITDIVVVVVGILIAFSLDALWDRWLERKEGMLQLVVLEAEFTGNVEAIRTAAAGHQRLAVRSGALFKLLQVSPSGQVLEVPDTLLGASLAWRTADIPIAAVNALLASGRLHLIRDAELRNLLAAWPAEVQDADEDQLLGRDFVYQQLIPGLATRAAIANLIES